MVCLIYTQALDSLAAEAAAQAEGACKGSMVAAAKWCLTRAAQTGAPAIAADMLKQLPTCASWSGDSMPDGQRALLSTLAHFSTVDWLVYPTAVSMGGGETQQQRQRSTPAELSKLARERGNLDFTAGRIEGRGRAENCLTIRAADYRILF